MIATLATMAVLSGIAVVLAGLYLLPVLLAWARHAPDIGAVAAINILLGWTLAGWAVALAMSLRSGIQPGPTIQVVQHLPPAQLPPGQYPDGRWPAAAPPLILPPADEPTPPADGNNPQW